MNPTLLRDAGEALYGPLWQSALARDLGVTDRTVRRWAAADYPIPHGIWYELKQILKQRRFAIAAVMKRFPR